MIRELVEYGERIRKEIYGELNSDALSKINLEGFIVIDETGNFIDILPLSEQRLTIIEDVVRMEDAGRTSGILPRFLVDNAQYLLAYPKEKARSQKCHQEYLKKLNRYKEVDELTPVFHFFEKNGIDRAYPIYDFLIKNKEIKNGNLAFLLKGEEGLIHENANVYQAIEDEYQRNERDRNTSKDDKCSVCGSSDYRSINVTTHDSISRVPSGQPSGCYLISYNADAFFSYSQEGNNNARLCTHCIKNYNDGLNWLMLNGNSIIDERGKERFRYTNRKNIGDDTAVVFWTREAGNVDLIHQLDDPDIDEVAHLLEAAMTGAKQDLHLEEDMFYMMTLSSAAARIAMRDWVEISLSDVKLNLAQWFDDICVIPKNRINFPSLYRMASSCDNSRTNDKQLTSRIGSILLQSAIKKLNVPLWVLSTVLHRIRAEKSKDDNNKYVESVTPERAGLIKLILNRNLKNGGKQFMPELDPENKDTAYVCGKIFAVLERIQWHALGETNANIRDRFFSSASTTPGLAFGRLLSLAQKHLSKIKTEKPGLYVNLDRELQELCKKIEESEFPATFRLEEQGAFALGYYHQKNRKNDEN